VEEQQNPSVVLLPKLRASRHSLSFTQIAYTLTNKITNEENVSIPLGLFGKIIKGTVECIG
jgi:hypothetical protein